jgi:hypothetical protein
MSDSWEDWENDDYEVPVLNVPTAEQLKRIEEHRLIEESDFELAKDLISNNKKYEDEDLAYEELKQTTKFMHIPNNSFTPLDKPNKVNNKQKENEQKQKDLSKKLKEEKIKKEKAREMFGEAEYNDEYADYEDKFY